MIQSDLAYSRSITVDTTQWENNTNGYYFLCRMFAVPCSTESTSSWNELRVAGAFLSGPDKLFQLVDIIIRLQASIINLVKFFLRLGFKCSSGKHTLEPNYG